MLDCLLAPAQIETERKRRRGEHTLKYHLSFDGTNRYDLYLKVMRRSGRTVGLLCSRFLSAEDKSIAVPSSLDIFPH